jgi:thiol-disulfide isomerase/thioredoxin
MDDDESKKKLEKSIYKGNVITVQFMHCGDRQGDVIEKSFKSIRTIDEPINIISKRNNDLEESFFVLLPNVLLKAEMDAKMEGIVRDILSMDEIAVSSSISDFLEQINTPVFLKLFISPYCPFCPKIIKDVAALAVKNQNINIEIIDGILNEEQSKKYGILSVPTLIFDENFRWSGQVKLEAVVETLANTKPELLTARSLRTMIEAGRASALAALMIERGKIFDSLYELLVNEKWSVRLGAMVVAEEIGQLCDYLSMQLMEKLWWYYEASNETIEGDIIYLSGELGSSIYRDKLEKILGDSPSPELLEAVNDALATLKTRFA